MFVPMIATFVMILIITAYMASNNMVGNASQVRLAFEKSKFTFNVEDMLKDAVDSLCQSESQTCKDKYDESTDSIKLTISDISDYLPVNFKNSNLIGGSFGDIYIKDNNSTIEFEHDVPSDIKRNVYLHHYRGLEYSIKPECKYGDEDNFPPCSTDDVIHDYPTAANTRSALQ